MFIWKSEGVRGRRFEADIWKCPRHLCTWAKLNMQIYVGMGTKMKRNGGRLCFCVRMVAKKILQTTKMITQKPFCANSVFGCFLSHGGTPSHHPFYSGFSMKNIPILGVPHFMLSNEASAPWDRNWDLPWAFLRGALRWKAIGVCWKLRQKNCDPNGRPWQPWVQLVPKNSGTQTPPWVSILSHARFWLWWFWGTPILGNLQLNYWCCCVSVVGNIAP